MADVVLLFALSHKESCMALLHEQLEAIRATFGLQGLGEPDFIHEMGQWVTVIWIGAAEVRVNFLPGTVIMRFFAHVATMDANHQAFMEIKEPSLAFAVPENVKYVDPSTGAELQPDERIAGIVCQDGPRFSLSSPSAPKRMVSPDGVLTIDDRTWHLHTLQRPDGRRVRNYNAFFGLRPVESVHVVELGNFPMFRS